jgi:outer membrane protein assembly factor BamB
VLRSYPIPTRRQAICCTLGLLTACWLPSPLVAADWPQFRGPQSNSVATGAQPPATWSETENIAWRADLPGRGPSSPIVVGDRVVVTCSGGIDQNRLHVLCFDAQTGKPLWQRQFWATGRTLSHPSSANAAPTPASDGKFVFAFFSSNDLICLDLEGNLKWLRGLAYDFPHAGNDTGMSSSPVVIGNVVVAQIECQGDSFVTGVDKLTGETRWRIDRPHEASWTSPVVARGTGQQQDAVLLQSPSQLTAHDPESGRQLWAYQVPCDGISSAVAVDGMVYAASNGTTALKPSADGQPEVLWNETRLKPGAASMLIADGRLLMVNRAGVLTCASATEGEILWRLRLEGAFWGTPTLVGNRLYAISQDGKGQVVELSADGSGGEVVGKSQLEGTFQGSPAIAEGALYLRSDKHLWKIAAP